jgi:hypothetical protein
MIFSILSFWAYDKKTLAIAGGGAAFKACHALIRLSYGNN